MAATWTELPEQVRVVVHDHVGAVTRSEAVTGGENNDVAEILFRPGGPPVFLKGIEGVSRRMRMLRNESAAGRLAPGIAPAVLFAADVDGWFIVGFEYVSGRPVNLAPGSADLALVASTVEAISARPAPGLRTMHDRWSVDWWAKLDGSPSVAGWNTERASLVAAPAPELATGDRLAHTDLHRHQFIVDDTGRASVIDWGFPAAAAPWVDAAYLILRLIDAGHAPADAERWAWSLACFADADPDAVTAFAVYVAGMWTYWADEDPAPGKIHRAALARRYAAWCLDRN